MSLDLLPEKQAPLSLSWKVVRMQEGPTNFSDNKSIQNCICLEQSGWESIHPQGHSEHSPLTPTQAFMVLLFNLIHYCLVLRGGLSLGPALWQVTHGSSSQNPPAVAGRGPVAAGCCLLSSWFQPYPKWQGCLISKGHIFQGGEESQEVDWGLVKGQVEMSQAGKVSQSSLQTGVLRLPQSQWLAGSPRGSHPCWLPAEESGPLQ